MFCGSVTVTVTFPVASDGIVTLIVAVFAPSYTLSDTLRPMLVSGALLILNVPVALPARGLFIVTMTFASPAFKLSSNETV